MINRKLTYLMIFFAVSNLFGTNIPINAVQKGNVSDWLFMGPLNKNTPEFDLIGKIEKDPLNYFDVDSLDPIYSKIKYIKSDLIYGGQMYYQLYAHLERGDVIFAFSFLDSKKDQNVIFDINCAHGNIEFFLNSKFIKNVDNIREYPEARLKKGRNQVLLKINPDNYTPESFDVFHRFFFSVVPDTIAAERSWSGGIGVGTLGDMVWILAPNSPADAAGLKVGDRIRSVDGRLWTSWR